MKDFLIAVAVIAGMIDVGWLATGNDLLMSKFFAPKQEQVRREVFEQSKAYRQGVVQELQNMQFEYVKASDAHKDALASIILHRAADVPAESMPMELSSFISELRSKK